MVAKRMATKQEIDTLEPEIELKETAIGLAFVDNRWTVYELKFDPESGEAAVLTKEACELGKDEARARFKMWAATKVLF